MKGNSRAPNVKIEDPRTILEPEAREKAPRPFRTMARGDLWALVINGLFGVLGLVILPSNPSVGIVTTALFGSGAVFLGWLHWRRYQDQKLRPTIIEVAGGVRILPRRALLLTTGAWLACLGVVLVVFGQSYPALFRWLGGFVALSGTTLLILVALKIVPAGFLQFEPQGLIIGQRGWQVLVPWDLIVDVQQTEFQNNPMVLLTVSSIEDLQVTPAAAQPRALRAMAGKTWFSQRPFAIMPLHYGIPSPVLAAAISRYAGDAEARKGLGTRQLPAWNEREFDR